MSLAQPGNQAQTFVRTGKVQYYYTKLQGVAPAEADMQRYFRVTAPTVHDTVLALERIGLVAREPGKARSIRLLLTRAELPDLA